MVHGDVRDEKRLLETEAAIAPEFMRIYFGRQSLDSRFWPGSTIAGSATSSWPTGSWFRQSTSAQGLVRHGTRRLRNCM